MSRMELVISRPGTRIISAPIMTASTLATQRSAAARKAAADMRNEAAIVLKKGFASSRCMCRVTKPIISPIAPDHSQSLGVPPNTGQKPAAVRKLPR